MTAVILRFPSRPPSVRVERENGQGGQGWLVLAPRGHAWLHGAFPEALADARDVAVGFNAIVRSSAGRTP
jgi:hypothetical protein